MEHKDGIFYLFFSAFFRDRGRERSHVVGITTLDWRHFSDPFLMIDGKENGWTGNGIYYLTFNSWGEEHPNGEKNQLFVITSMDLVHWSPYQRIGRNLTQNLRCIDIAITFANYKFYIIWKDESIRVPLKKYSARIATAEDIFGEWTFIIDGYPEFYLQGKQLSLLIHENYQFLVCNDQQFLLCLDYRPSHPVLYQIGGDPHQDANWLRWEEGVDLNIPQEKFNTQHIANAPFIADWRIFDGSYYILYAGRTIGFTHAGRGNNKLGLARSTDLVNWMTPPKF